jgi:hypothetical protein
MAPQEPQIKPGEIKIRRIELLILHKDVEVWEVHLGSRYPEVHDVGSDYILLERGVNTLDPDEERLNLLTTIRFPRSDGTGDWELMVDGNPRSFYKFSVCLFKIPL